MDLHKGSHGLTRAHKGSHRLTRAHKGSHRLTRAHMGSHGLTRAYLYNISQGLKTNTLNNKTTYRYSDNRIVLGGIILKNIYITPVHTSGTIHKIYLVLYIKCRQLSTHTTG